MQIAIADRKRVAALKRIWNKKMQEVQAVMSTACRTTRVNRERVMVGQRFHFIGLAIDDVSQIQQRMRVDSILDSIPEGTQNAQPIDQTILLELAREKLSIMRLAHRQRVFEFHSQTQQSKSVSGLRASVLANFPQILSMYGTRLQSRLKTDLCRAVPLLLQTNSGSFTTPKHKHLLCL